MNLNPQAEELNDILSKSSSACLDVLSRRGRNIFFPNGGVMAQSSEAKGKKVNATIGIALEDDLSPIRLQSIEGKVKLDPREVFTYETSFGNKTLRETWKKKIYEKNPRLSADISLPMVTQALTNGLSILGYMFLDEGDTVISPDKFWGNYKLIFENSYFAKIDTFETFNNDGFNIEGLREKLLSNGEKKVLLLNFPNNPTGYTPTEEEAESIRDIIKEAADEGKKILVVLDDAYFGLVYEKSVICESLFSFLADLHENILAVKIDGATKEDYVWGLRVGFITYGGKGLTKECYDALEDKTAGALRGTLSNVSNLSQNLVLKAFLDKNYISEKKEKYELLKSRYIKVKEVLKDEIYYDYFKPLPYNSGYFMCVKMNENYDAEEIRKILLEKFDTGVIAISNIIRIAFSALSEPQIKILFDNIVEACKLTKGTSE